MLRVCRRKCPDGKLPHSGPCLWKISKCLYIFCVCGRCVCLYTQARMLKGKQMLRNVSFAPSFVGGPRC